ncbi:MAG: hypothetical protein Q7R65_00130 [bacterium]|nr:hypothetical protein [bacterium]
MKLYKTFTALLVVIFTLAFSFSLAFAKDNEESESSREIRNKAEASTTLHIKVDDDKDDIRATSSDKFEQEDINDDEGDDNDDDGDEGDIHERRMKGIVKHLNDIHPDVPGIGDEIREIARNEASSTEERVRAMHEIQRQHFLSRFFFGPDTQRIKVLSDELKTTQKNIDRLNIAKNKIASTTLQAKLDEQIKALETARINAESFVKENHDAFSVFGFFSRLFGR